jgi:hypothetical protein
MNIAVGILCLVMSEDALCPRSDGNRTPSSPPPVFEARGEFLLFVVLIAEKPASHRYDVEKGNRVSVAFFGMMGVLLSERLQE